MLQAPWNYVLGAVATVGVLLGDKIVAGLWSWGTRAKTDASKPTLQQTLDAATVLATFKANCSDDPMYAPGMAAIRALLEDKPA